MLHRKLLEVLSRMSPKEHRQMKLYLQSPYFTQGMNSALLNSVYDYIIMRKADESHPELSRSAAFHHFFPEKKYQEKEKNILDSILSDLFRILKHFLAQQEFDKDLLEVDKALPLMRFYRKNGLEERFWQTAEAVLREHENIKNKGANFYFNQFRIEEEISNFRGVFNTYEDDANLNRANLFIDKFFGVIKLEQACALEHRNKSSDISIQTSTLLREVLSEQNANIYADVPLVEIYKDVLYLIRNPADEGYLNMFGEKLDSLKVYIPTEKFRDLKAYYRAFWVRLYLRFGNDFYRSKGVCSDFCVRVDNFNDQSG